MWGLNWPFNYFKDQLMNGKDKQDLELVHYRLDELDKKIDGVRSCLDRANKRTDESLNFIKENLFFFGGGRFSKFFQICAKDSEKST